MTREQSLAADQEKVSMKAFWRRRHLLKLNNKGGVVEVIEPSGGQGLDMFEGLKDSQGREGSR